jgi:ribonucleoside-diphosphate reductase beta chain
MFTRYDSFVILAESLQWDEATIDFALDKATWPTLEDTENAQVLGLIAGFCIAESAVSGHLGSFQAAASDDWVAACFRAQARDEYRHARFFDRVAAEVAAVPGPTLRLGMTFFAPSSVPSSSPCSRSDSRPLPCASPRTARV